MPQSIGRFKDEMKKQELSASEVAFINLGVLRVKLAGALDVLV